MSATVFERRDSVARECLVRGIRPREVDIMLTTVYFRGLVDTRQGTDRGSLPPDETYLTRNDYDFWRDGISSLSMRMRFPAIDIVSEDQVVIDLSGRE